MLLNKKLLATLGLSSVVVFSAWTAAQPQREEPKLTNIKVLPKKLTYRQVDHIMDEWAHSLGVRCNFCHAPKADGGRGMDFASDAKPEKHAAREMFKMMNTINKKFFKAEKDSTGMVMTAGINCYTCHRGTAHPEVVAAPAPQRMGPPPGGGQPGTPPPGNGK